MKIILSIKPEYAEKIFSEEKKFEYRKRIPAAIEEVLVYASSPIKEVIGKFYVKSILEDTPSMLWKNTQKWGGISKDDYESYFGNRESGYAIEIAHVEKFIQPRTLSEYSIKVPPQSYAYI